MYYEILKYLRNFYPDEDKRMIGKFSIEDNVITPCPSLGNQYVLIEGSKFNDGVVYHRGAFTSLDDEEFEGVVTPLKLPMDLIDLMDDIKGFEASNVVSPYNSESFGGYSYSKNAGAGWQTAFRDRLKAWRKI